MRTRVVWLCTGLVVASALAACAASASSGRPVDLASKGFGLHMKLTLPRHWQVLPSYLNGPPASETVVIVHVGTPSSDESQWWGPDIMLVNGALVHRPVDAASRQPAHPDRSKFVRWPSDFFAYLSALPGVRVTSRPRPVKVGGLPATQITVETPPMHPLVWLKGDAAWIGGGRSGVDPAMTRRIVLLDVKGKKLFLAFADTPTRFEKRWPTVQQLFSSIRF